MGWSDFEIASTVLDNGFSLQFFIFVLFISLAKGQAWILMYGTAVGPYLYHFFPMKDMGWNGIYNIAANPNTICIDPSSCLPMVDLPALYIYDAVYMWFNVKTLDNPIIELLFFILLISDCLVQAQPLREGTQFGKLWPIQSYH